MASISSMNLVPIHGSHSKLLAGVTNFKKMFFTKLSEFAAKGNLVKTPYKLAAAAKMATPMPKAKPDAPKAAKKDVAKPKTTAAAAKTKKAAAIGLAVTCYIVFDIIVLSSAGDGAAASPAPQPWRAYGDGRAEPELWSPYAEAEASARSRRESSLRTPWRCLGSVCPSGAVPHRCFDEAEAASQPVPTFVACLHRPPSPCHPRCRSAGDEPTTTAGFPILLSSFVSKASRWGAEASRSPISLATKASRWGTDASWWVLVAVVWGPYLSRVPHELVTASPSPTPATCRGGHAATPRDQHTTFWWLGAQALLVAHRGPFLLNGHHRRTVQPLVLLPHAPNRQLLLWHWLDDSASIWVFGPSFFYLRRRYQQHPSIVGMILPQQLHRPTFNRRYARSVHLGARVFDASAYTPRWQIHHHQRLSRCYCLSLWSQDLDVTQSSFEDLYVILLP